MTAEFGNAWPDQSGVCSIRKKGSEVKVVLWNCSSEIAIGTDMLALAEARQVDHSHPGNYYSRRILFLICFFT